MLFFSVQSLYRTAQELKSLVARDGQWAPEIEAQVLGPLLG